MARRVHRHSPDAAVLRPQIPNGNLGRFVPVLRETTVSTLPCLTIHRVTPADPALLKALLAVFGSAFGEPETYGGAIPGDAYLARLLAKEHVIALAAITDGRVVGGLVAYELEKFERERSEIYIYDLAVAAAHRRQGIATALIEDLRRIGSARGAHVIFVQADPGDDPAIALYTKLGVREDVHHFDVPVPRPQE